MIDLKAFLAEPERYLRGWERRGKLFRTRGEALLREAQARQTGRAQQQLEELQALINAGSKLVPTLQGAERTAELKKFQIASLH